MVLVGRIKKKYMNSISTLRLAQGRRAQGDRSTEV